jgi:peptidoglycan/xylan/chitin deacetylase (PgdA/CDA1 family)
MVRILHNIGPRVNENYTPLEVAASCKDRLTFDGIYLNVWENRKELFGLEVMKRRPILFVMGDFVGGNNAFDTTMPPERYCDWQQLLELVANYGCEIGWHTWSHRRLSWLNDEELKREVTPPFPMKHFAYPYGNFDARVLKAVEAAGYAEAWSVDVGDDSRLQRRRNYL